MSKALLDWYRAQRAVNEANPSPAPGAILLGGMVWGEKYLDRLAKLCVASLMAPENLAAIAGHARLAVYTIARDVEALAAVLEPLDAAGIEVGLYVMPDALIELRTQSVLAAVQRVLLAQTAQNGCGFHPLFPDHVYSNRFMPNLARLAAKHAAIAQMTISGQLETAAPYLDAHRQSGTLNIEARDLGSIAHANFHQQTRPFVINDLPPGQMTPTPYFVWRLADRLIIHCCHMNPEWMSNEVCQAVPEPNKNTVVGALDCSLPFVFPKNWYTPTLDDEMTCIEFSDNDKPARTSGPIEDMADLAWHVMRFGDDYMPYLRRRSVLPLHPHDGNVVVEEQVDSQFEAVLAYMLSNRRQMAEESIQQRARELGWLKPGEESPHSRLKRAQQRASLL